MARSRFLRRRLQGSWTFADASGNARQVVIQGDNYASVYFESTPGADRPVHQLPAAARDFSGRDADVDEIESLAGVGVVPSVIDIYGAPGVGKSALAVHVAHRLTPWFGEVQLYADLGEQNGEVPTAAQIQQRFVADLDPTTAAVPVGAGELPQRYRSLLSRKKCLILLDNAQSAEQVADLVPGSGSCAVLITSRVPLATLDGVVLHHLDLMSQEEALTLLSQVSRRNWSGAAAAAAAGVGAGADADADAGAEDLELARTLADQCGRLPLALRIAGAILKKKHYWPLSRLVAEFADERTRLARLAEGSLDVRGSFEISYRDLPTEEAQAFRLLALLPLTRFEARHAAIFLRIPEERALRILEALADVQLVETTDGIHFRYHDLLRLFAREHCESAGDDPDGARMARFLEIFTSDFLESYRARLLNSQWSESSLTGYEAGLPGSSHATRRIAGPDALYVPQWLTRQDLRLTWQDALSEQARVLVLGGAGTGKTILADRICYEVATRREDGRFDAAFTAALRRRSDRRQSLEQLVRDSVRVRHDLEMPYETLELLLHQRRTLIVFDGLDELTVPERDQVRTDVVAFCAAYPLATVVVTSRPGVSTDGFDASGFSRYEVARFSGADIHAYLAKWVAAIDMPAPMGDAFIAEVMASAATADWLSTPLLVAQLAIMYEEYGFLPRTVGELYGRTFELLFESRDSARGIVRSAVPSHLVGEVVCALAFEFVTRWSGRGDISSEQLLDGIRSAALRSDREWMAEKAFVQDVIRLLAESDYPVRPVKDDSDGQLRWTLVRDPFGQYLAARWIVGYGDAVEDVVEAVHASGFVEGAVFVAELRGPRGTAGLVAALRSVLDGRTDPVVRGNVLQILRSLENDRRA
ncbi:NACHT domain-containing protein [Streptomyces sp. NPDC001658]